MVVIKLHSLQALYPLRGHNSLMKQAALVIASSGLVMSPAKTLKLLLDV
jgi:hypothetical protein